MTLHQNTKIKKSYAEEEFKKVYGAYPNENELKQFLPYLKSSKLDRMWNLTTAKI